MARKHVRVKVLVSFNGLKKGDESDAWMDDRLRGWIKAGLIKVVGDGARTSRQGRAEQDDHERIPDGAAGSGSSSGEPREGFGAGGYGAPEVIDQG